MDNVVDFIRDRHGIENINLMGICMGGTFSIIYSALHPEKIKNLVTTVTPSNFETDQGLLHIWTKGINLARIIEAYGNMPGDLLNLCFLLLNPARLVIDKYINFFENMDNKEFIENFVRMEKWVFDSPDVPGETIRQFIEDCYQKNLLIQSRMEVGGNRDTEDLCLETGHIGIYVSSKSQKQFTPKIDQWLKQREGAPESESKTESENRPQRKPITGKTAAASKASPKKKKAPTQTRTSA